MKFPAFAFALALAASVQFMVASGAMLDDPDAKYATSLVKPGEVAPDFTLRTLSGRGKLKLSSLRGKYVVLDFWASWCPDCRRDIPEMLRMYRDFHGRGVEFVGVSMDTERAKLDSAVRKYGIPYTQVSEYVRMRESKTAKAYGVEWIPSMCLIDPEGKVVLSTVLYYKLEKKLTELFPLKPVAGTSEKISINGQHGRLAAVLTRPAATAGGNTPLAILMHGFGGNKESPLLGLVSDSLIARGIATLRFDFDGHGESEGKFSKMTVPDEVDDALKVYDYARALPGVSEIAFVGHSQGGVVAGMSAGQLGAGKVKAVALLAPAAVLRDDAIRGNTFGAVYDPLDPPDSVSLPGGRQLGAEYIRTAFRLPIYETSAKFAGPAAIVHGTGDRIVPFSYGERYHDIWPGSEITLLERFDHGFSQNPYRVAAIVAGFLAEKLNVGK